MCFETVQESIFKIQYAVPILRIYKTTLISVFLLLIEINCHFFFLLENINGIKKSIKDVGHFHSKLVYETRIV